MNPVEAELIKAGHPRFTTPAGDQREHCVPCDTCRRWTAALRPTRCLRCLPLCDRCEQTIEGEVHHPHVVFCAGVTDEMCRCDRTTCQACCPSCKTSEAALPSLPSGTPGDYSPSPGDVLDGGGSQEHRPASVVAPSDPAAHPAIDTPNATDNGSHPMAGVGGGVPSGPLRSSTQTGETGGPRMARTAAVSESIDAGETQ